MELGGVPVDAVQDHHTPMSWGDITVYEDVFRTISEVDTEL